MEASTLKPKKNAVSKGKIKKNIKNVLCRPDPIHWPQVTEEQGEKLQLALIKHKIEIPEFEKLHWNKLKLIPKIQRPKQPKIKKADGLLFGTTECNNAIMNRQCSAVIIEASVNPRLIVQPVIVACTERDIPIVCLHGLRKISVTNFGIPTSCLGVKTDMLLDLRDEIVKIAGCYPKPHKNVKKGESKVPQVITINLDDKMNVVDENTDVCDVKSASPFLYRTNKKTRVFVPTNQSIGMKITRKFIGQDFIEFSNKPEVKDRKEYMKMLLKRMSNNAARPQKK